MSVWGGDTLILAGIREEVTLQKGSDLKKGWVHQRDLIERPHSALGALANMPVLCLENHGKQGIRTPHPNSTIFFAIEF